jgi:hypothetical protein
LLGVGGDRRRQGPLRGGRVSTGEGCAAADATTENAKIVEAKVSLNKSFEKRFKSILRPPWKRAYKPGESILKLTGPHRLRAAGGGLRPRQPPAPRG